MNAGGPGYVRMPSISTTPIDQGCSIDTDEAALVQAASRDPAAFGPLHERYAERVYRYLRARTDSEEDAADLTQQVFLHALAALPRYSERGLPFAAWLFRIAANLVSDGYRRKRPMVGWESLSEERHPTAEQDLEAAVLRREAISRLRVLLADLDAEQRELVLLRFMAGLRVREIAAVLGKGESTVHRHLACILNLLKERYDEA